MATIQIHASFPCVKLPGAEVDLAPDNWHWLHSLTFPVETLRVHEFSRKPYKWIRYAIGVVAGAEGELSSSKEMLNVVNYDADLPAASVILYYHLSDKERRRIFPIDPDIGRTTVTASVASARRVQFRKDVKNRDGGMCVLSGMGEQLCNAVHLLAHSKGNAYITEYTRGRSRDPTGSDIIHDIDSIQNGLFLNKLTHVVLGKDVAFLVTPNFAMNTDDIDDTALPVERRCTAHLFQPNDTIFLGRESLSSGTPLRMSNGPQWPPASLFDAVYASTLLHHFGDQSLGGVITKTLKNIFYPGGVMTAAGAENKKSKDLKAAATQRVTDQAQERGVRYEARIGQAPLADLLDQAQLAELHDQAQLAELLDQGPLAELFDQLQRDQLLGQETLDQLLDRVTLKQLLEWVPIGLILAFMPYTMLPEDKQKTLLEDAKAYAEVTEQRHVYRVMGLLIRL